MSNQKRRNFQIEALKNLQVDIDPNYADKTWNILEHAIYEIYNHNASYLSFEDLYRFPFIVSFFTTCCCCLLENLVFTWHHSVCFWYPLCNYLACFLRCMGVVIIGLGGVWSLRVLRVGYGRLRRSSKWRNVQVGA